MRAAATPVLLLALVAGAAPAGAATDDGGQPEAWTRLEVGARTAALGGATSAVEQDPFALQWNPALASSVEDWHLFGQSALLPDARNLEVVGFTDRPSQGALGWGASYAQINTPGGLEARTSNTLTPDSTFSDGASLMRLGLADWLPGERVSLGLDLKLYSHALDQSNATGFSEDLGVLWRAREGLDVSLALSDPLNIVTWTTGLAERIPLGVRAGGAARFLGDRLLLSCDVQFSADQGPQPHAGLECWVWSRVLALRVGFDNGQVAAGLGAAAEIQGALVHLDYAAATDATASDQLQNRLSLDVSFN